MTKKKKKRGKACPRGGKHRARVEVKREGGEYWYRAVCVKCRTVLIDWHA